MLCTQFTLQLSTQRAEISIIFRNNIVMIGLDIKKKKKKLGDKTASILN